MKEKYYLFVICGYIAFLTLIVCVLAVPNTWRIGILALAAVLISYTMSKGKGWIAGSHHDPDH